MVIEESISEDHIKALGRVVHSFQLLEGKLLMLTERLISQDNTIGLIVTSNISFKNLLVISGALLKYKLSNRVDLIEKSHNLLEKAENANIKRNQLMHSLWFSYEGGTIQHKKKIRKKDGLKLDYNRTEALELVRTADEFIALGDDIWSFAQLLNTEKIIETL